MKRFSLFSTAIAAALLAACGGGNTGDGGSTAPSGEADETLIERVVKTDAGGYMMGDPDAPVKLTEYASLICVHCRDFEQEAYDDIKQMVAEGKIAFELRNFLLGAADIAPTILSRCAGPERYFALTDAWYDNWDAQMEAIQTGLGDESFRQSLAQMEPTEAGLLVAERTGAIDFFTQRGISREQAEACLTDEAGLQELETLRSTGIDEGVEGTPTIFVNGQKVDFQGWPALKEQLAEAGAG